MGEFFELIQSRVPIGSKISFQLKSGRDISGVLKEIGGDYVTIECEAGPATVLIEMIGAWQVLEQQPESRKELAEAKLLEIEARFDSLLQTAKIEMRRPDFSFPSEEFGGKQPRELARIWGGIRDKYEYAVKINELGVKFGRIQTIISQLQILDNSYPNSPPIKRHLAHLFWLSGDAQQAIKCCQDAAIAFKDPWDWHNVAALALKDNREELATYGLEQFFQRIPIGQAADDWYVLVRLVNKLHNYGLLSALSKTKADGCSEEEREILIGTGVYLLKESGLEQNAREIARKWAAKDSLALLASEAFQHLRGEPSETYKRIETEFTITKEVRRELPVREVPSYQRGYIHDFNPDRNFGFLRGVDGQSYFFHRSAVTDDDLLQKLGSLKPGEETPVVFEAAQGLKGLLAMKVRLSRTVDEMFLRATDYASTGEYSQAIAQIKNVLDMNPQYPGAQECYDKWREYARVTGVPKGSNPYALAKRAHLVEKDISRAVELLSVAISKRDHVESAVKDLAVLLNQQGKSLEAIQVLKSNRSNIEDQESLDNMLISFYRIAGEYNQAIQLLQRKLGHASSETKKASLAWQMAHCYLRQKNYVEAERSFRTVLRLQSENKAAERNLAACVFSQGRYDEAEKMVNAILDTSPDTQAEALLEAITRAKETGKPGQIDEVIIETTLSDLPTEITGFAQFLLDRCDFQGVPPDRVQTRDFNRADIQKLEELATQLGTRRPRDRAGYYLSAAKIVRILDEWEDPNQFYKYLCRSFASRGDATVVENGPLDSAREFYCEAVSVYDWDRSGRGVEQDAANALVRFLFSTLGQAQIPIKPNVPSVDETIEYVLNHHPQRERVFDAIAYLIVRSRFAANRILNRLYAKSSLQAMALEYLRAKGSSIPSPPRQLQSFIGFWNEVRRKDFDEARSVAADIRFLSKAELTTSTLEDGIERAKRLGDCLFLDLDQQRMVQLRKILETALELCRQVAFEEQERLCIQIDGRCQNLMREIGENPTRLSVEEVSPVIQVIQERVKDRLEELYRSSTPQLSLRLPVESFTPGDQQRLEVQIVVLNRVGCSPAEAIELIVKQDEDFFVLNVPEVRLDSSLRGGDQRILKVPITVRETALRSRTFSFPVYVQYRTRSDEIARTQISNFSIRLYSGEEFETIENPYAPYAEGGVVGDPQMFYGREELIENVARAITEARFQSKSILIFGQKRAGKSSVLSHRELPCAKSTGRL